MSESDPEPIIVNGNPTILPLRGPLGLPTNASAKSHIGKLLQENDMLLSAVEDVINGYVNLSPHDPADQVLHLIKRLHQNLIFVAAKDAVT